MSESPNMHPNHHLFPFCSSFVDLTPIVLISQAASMIISVEASLLLVLKYPELETPLLPNTILSALIDSGPVF
jgi:hypothetical protein